MITSTLFSLLLSNAPGAPPMPRPPEPDFWTCTAQDANGKYYQEQRWNQASATAAVIQTCEATKQTPCRFLGCFND